MNLMQMYRQHRYHRAALLGLVAALAACSGANDDGERNPSGNGLVFHPHPVTPPEPKPLPQVLPDAYRTPRNIGTLPERFRGRYAITATDCTAFDKRLTVEGRYVEVGSRRRVVDEARALSPTKVRLSLQLDRQGDERWRLTLLHDDRTLLVERSGPMPTSRYQRCPSA